MHFSTFRQRGFTLIELLVVILIIAILIAVAAPSFLKQKDKAHDSSAQQTLSVVRKELKTTWTSSSDSKYPALNALVQEVQEGEPQYTITSFDSATPPAASALVQGTTYLDRVGDDSAVACLQSKSNRWFCLETFESSSADVLATLSSNVAWAAGKTQTRKSSGASIADAVAALSPTAAGAASKGPGGTGNANWAAGEGIASSAPTSTPTPTTPPTTPTTPTETASSACDTASERSLYNASRTRTSPAAFYPMNETTGTAMKSVIAGAPDGTYGNVTLGFCGGSKGLGTAARANDEYENASIPTSVLGTSDVFSANFTIEARFQVTDPNQKGAIIMIGSNENGFGIGMGNGHWGQAGNPSYLMSLNEYVAWHPYYSKSPSVGWHHVAMVQDGNYTNYYLDGDFVASEYAFTNGSFPMNPAAIHFGGYASPVNPERGMQTAIDDIAIYHNSRSACEIKGDYLKATDVNVSDYGVCE